MVLCVLTAYEERLRRALPMTFLALTDVTDGHAAEGVKDGRALSGDGRDILILAVSDAWEGMPILERQRAVNDVLSEDLSTGRLHSVRIKCMTKPQWATMLNTRPIWPPTGAPSS
tara:strand:+ start:816 stop:1160 length:345 start_codon:yes stop_codon:yes gene_type:complete